MPSATNTNTNNNTPNVTQPDYDAVHLLSSIAIQTQYRMIKARISYLGHRRGCIMIQSAWRGYGTRQTFLKTIAQISMMQAVWRRTTAVRDYRYKRAACIMVQSHWRSYHAGQIYRGHQRALLRLQSWRRALFAKREYQQQLRGVVLIQSHWRRIMIGRSYRQQRAAATIVQALVRSWRTQTDYSSTKSACERIQQTWRAARALGRDRQVKEQRALAAVSLQSSIRVLLARATYRHSLGAIALLQARSRGLLHRQRYKRQKTAAIQLQSYSRCMACQVDFSRKKVATHLIQSSWRSFIVREKFKDNVEAANRIIYWWRRIHQSRIQAATKLESMVRRDAAQQCYTKKLLACILIQSSVRCQMAKTEYHQSRGAILQLQTSWRAFSRCTEFREKRAACLMMQAWVRRWLHLRRYKKDLSNITLAQSAMRAYLVRTMLVQQKQREAVITIQSHWRTMARVRSFAISRTAAILVQSAWKSHFHCQRFATAQLASTIIANQWRAASARAKWSESRASIIMLQTLARMRARKSKFQTQKQAIIGLQSHMRAWYVRRDLAEKQKEHELVAFVIALQAMARARTKQQAFLRTKRASVRVQSRVRILLAQRRFEDRREERSRMELRRCSAITLQSVARASFERSSFLLQRQAAMMIQSTIRAHRARQHCKKVREAAAATMIQRIVRMGSTKSRFELQRAAAVSLQSQFRGIGERRLFEHQREAAMLIQARMRGTMGRQSYRMHSNRQRELNALGILQNFVRSRAVKLMFQRQKSAASALQSQTRRFLEHQAYQRKRDESQKINLFNETRAATKLQKRWRDFVTSRNSKRTLGPATTIQEEKQQDNSPLAVAAVCIQKIYRGFCERVYYTLQKDAALRISRFYILWKTKLLLLKIQCATVLLRRSRALQGHIPKCTSFALSQVSSCLKSDLPLATGKRGLSRDVALHVGYIWGMASTQAKDCAAVVVQRYGRGLLYRRRFNRQRHSIETIQRCVRLFLSNCRGSQTTSRILPDYSVSNPSVGVHFSESIPEASEDSTERMSSELKISGEEHSSTDTSKSTSYYSARESSDDDREYERGVESLSEFFENEALGHERTEDVTNWFLHRLEMKSETSAQLLLLNRTSTENPRMRRLAERARSARAQITGRGESKRRDVFAASPGDDPYFGIEGVLSPIEKKSIARDLR
mmetsp:Transcript_16083/g.36955  ORF Transcript_16083/g.36955 Transcript_16083/m.36955 type:complete len:1176 (+) Transcript_16083:1-3528(+)